MSIKPIAINVAILSIAILTFGFKVLQTNPEKPDANRFTETVLADNLDEPMEFVAMEDGKVYFIERRGKFKMYDPTSKSVKLIATINVNTKKTDSQGNKKDSEEGLLGLTFDPGFKTNHWIYLYYAHPTESKDILTRWELRNDQLIAGSEKVMLEVPVERNECCVTGGGMVFDAKNNLYLTVGNNTVNGTASHTDERPGRLNWDDQRASSNTNDLRGKTLRIHPEPDGTYSIPEGNLFPKGMPKTRPEIYTMGHRNPWRPFIDSKTGWLYFGEIGVDFAKETELGPRGYDAFIQARKAGNYGWPYFIGDVEAFPIFNYATNKPGDKKDPNKPTNSSVNNTGLVDLPPVQKPLIFYPYAVSDQFPLLGSGARTAVGGPVYHRADFKDPKHPFPAYYEGKLFVTDFIRNWIMAVSLDENGNYKSMEQFLPSLKIVSTMDMKFGADGNLYLLQYGSGWFKGNPDAKLVKIEYNSGNRPPYVQVSAGKTGGALPFSTSLSSAGTKDYDGDALKYEWRISSNSAQPVRIFKTANPTVKFDKPGTYTATLIVTDAKGANATKSIRLTAGNEAPSVSFDITKGNKSFFFKGKPIQYLVNVSDKEDGSTANKKIGTDEVSVTMDYLSEGYDFAGIIQGYRSVDASAQFASAQALINKTDCKTCHSTNTKSIGPMFVEIASKYKNDPEAQARLSKKIIGGGNGVWGDVMMPAHPALTANDANVIVKYILGINDKTVKTLPVSGTFTPQIPEADNGKGSYIFRAAYTDKGAKGATPLTAENVILLRSPKIQAQHADKLKGITFLGTRTPGVETAVVNGSGSYLAFNKIDLSGIQQIDLFAQAPLRDGAIGGSIEIHIDSPSGMLIGQVEIKEGSASRDPLTVIISSNTSVHDLYLVFVNERSKPGQQLVQLSDIQFK